MSRTKEHLASRYSRSFGDERDHIRDALTDPYQVCSALGLIDGPRSYERQSNGIMILCPWHDERSPSCSVQFKDGALLAHCFGCHRKGDVFSLVAVVHDLDPNRDFRRVLEIAADLANVRIVAPVRTPAPSKEKPPALANDIFDRIARLMLAVPLPGDAERYLASRGILECSRGSVAALPSSRDERTALRDQIIADVGRDAWINSGLSTRDGDGWYYGDTHRLVLCWPSDVGVNATIGNIQRRPLFPWPKERGNNKYLAAFNRTFPQPYGVDEAIEILGDGVPVAFVEGALDCIALRSLCHREGIERAVLGIPGVGGWLPAWAEYARGRVAYIAIDADKPGEDAVAGMAEDLYAAGAIAVKRSRPRTGKDWAELMEAS
jgi:DNA primase